MPQMMAPSYPPYGMPMMAPPMMVAPPAAPPPAAPAPRRHLRPRTTPAPAPRGGVPRRRARAPSMSRDPVSGARRPRPCPQRKSRRSRKGAGSSRARRRRRCRARGQRYKSPTTRDPRLPCVRTREHLPTRAVRAPPRNSSAKTLAAPFRKKNPLRALGSAAARRPSRRLPARRLPATFNVKAPVEEAPRTSRARRTRTAAAACRRTTWRPTCARR